MTDKKLDWADAKQDAFGALRKTLKLSDIVNSANVAAHLNAEDLRVMGVAAVEGFKADLVTREQWEQRNAKALEIALQLMKQKNFPWTGSSNVKFPLVTVAALQFLARIGALTSAKMLVKAEPWGQDPDGSVTAQCERIGTHMSFQLRHQNPHWMDDDEQAKFSASLLGCAIKKTYYDGVEGCVRSEFIPLMDFVVDYHCRDLAKAQRVTHRMYMYPNEVAERVRLGHYLPLTSVQVALDSDESRLQTASREISGLELQTQETVQPYEILEQHCWLDLDGDGYQEPYVMVVRKDTQQVLRIVARFFDAGDVFRVNDGAVRQLEAQANELEEGEYEAVSQLEKEAERLEAASDNKIVRIVPTGYFTKYPFIPSPDGGFYGLGLGALLGPTNAAVDTLINQMIDAGTMLVTSGGFVGSRVKLKAGKQSFDPFEWKPVDMVGDDLRKNIMPITVNAPPDVMFQLLGLLISYGEKVGSATDIMTGVSPGQNTPAETSRNTLEQGMMLFSGIYKRMYRAFTDELSKVYMLNRWYCKQMPDFQQLTQGPMALFAPKDYDSGTVRIFPSADAASVSAAQRQNKAKLVFEVMNAAPGGFDRYAVIKQLLEAHEVDGIEALYPNPQGPKAIPVPPNPEMEMQKMELQLKAQQHQSEMQLAAAELKSKVELEGAKVLELSAKAEKLLAEAAGVDDGYEISMLQAQMQAAKMRQETLLKQIELMQRDYHMERKLETDKELAKLKGRKDGASKE